MPHARPAVVAAVGIIFGGCNPAPPTEGPANGAGGMTASTGGSGGAAQAGTGSVAQGGATSSAGAGGAGTAGSSGASGSGGSSGGGGGGADGADDSMAKPSAGCGLTAADTPASFVQHLIQVGEHEREFFVRLPSGYDPTRAYPLAIIGAGCGGKGDDVIPLEEAAGADVIIAGLSPSVEVAGRDCFMTESPTSPEIDFFDAVLAAMKQGYCVDESRVTMSGFSSGSWLTNLIGCARGNLLRGQGNAAGGPPPLPECTGPIAAIMVHDTGDGSNSIDLGRQTRDRLRELDGCTETTMPWDAEFPDCVEYQGCMAGYPLVWCETSGQGHSENIPISTEGFWKFWSSLPPLP